MRTTGVIGVFVAAVALSGCTQADDAADRPVWARGPVIEAQGRAFVELPPNRASFSASYEARDAESAVASAEAVARANNAAEAVRIAAEGEVRITSNLSVRPYYQQVTRRTGPDREELVENVHPDALLGYVATVSMSVVVLDPERAASARGAALAAGPVSSGALRFYLEPDAENQRAAFAAAVRDAAQRARLIAEASGAELGTLQVLQEGQGPCLGSPSTATGYDDRVSVTAARAAAPPPPPPPPDATPQELAEAAERFALAADLQPQRIEARVCAIYSVR
ncbi:MAG: SIMPL domain-containing protein [Maricaulaceae bacterium]|nr:SIMPL domain-containing protein [Maricaulaceae bacterium]